MDYVLFTTESGHGFACDCGFESTKWRTRDHAQFRAEQHSEEHDTGEPMPNLREFYLLIGEEY